MPTPKTILFFLILIFSIMNSATMAQNKPVFNKLTSIPDVEGFAGMFAGVSGSHLFCMGGAKFQDKRPWEGGKKSWYDDIYMLQENNTWKKLNQKMPRPLAYGVSVSYQNTIFLIGGNDASQHYDHVVGCTWDADHLVFKNYPSLPMTVANMAGAVMGHYLIIAGGNSTPTTGAIKKCFIMDLEEVNAGWKEIPAWPGRERLLPVTSVYNNHFYLFSGETANIDANGVSTRVILEDAYRLSINTTTHQWEWEILAKMPVGFCASGNPAPVSLDGSILLWGGVDATTALHTQPATHPGFPPAMYTYLTATNEWKCIGAQSDPLPRVTLPVVYWNQQWIYVSGEIKAAVRTNTVVALKY